MKLIQPNCRVQFTPEDIEFIVRTLGHKVGDEQRLEQLLGDPETRDLILDSEQLFHGLLEFRGCLQVSNHFYFYVITRHVLKRTGIDDRSVADYLAEMLAHYSQLEHTRCHVPGQTGPLDYMFEMLAALKTADDRTSFMIRAHIGNHSLFLSGVFPERIRYRSEYKGFPDMRYYEAMGRSNFRIASDHRLAAEYDLAPIYATLSERFENARQALNDMSERLVSIGDNDAALDTFLISAVGPGGRTGF
jgi:hypothetical protein